MVTRAELKARSKDQLRGRWGLIIGVLILYSIIASGIPSALNQMAKPAVNISYNFNDYSSIVKAAIEQQQSSNNLLTMFSSLWTLLLGGVLTYGLAKFTLNFTGDEEKPSVNDLFSGFKVYFKTLGLYILFGLIIGLGFILLIVPGIIFTYMYSQSFFILAEDNSKSIMECLKESRKMMVGHKFEMFVLQLSFVGWLLLCIITLCIALLYVGPYMQTTMGNFYREVRKDYLVGKEQVI